MDEQKRNNDIEEAASALIKNAEADSVSLGEKREQKNGNGGNAGKAPEKAPGKEGKFLKKYKIKERIEINKEIILILWRVMTSHIKSMMNKSC